MTLERYLEQFRGDKSYSSHLSYLIDECLGRIPGFGLELLYVEWVEPDFDHPNSDMMVTRVDNKQGSVVVRQPGIKPRAFGFHDGDFSEIAGYLESLLIEKGSDTDGN